MSEPTGTQYGGLVTRTIAFLADLAIVFVIGTAVVAGGAMFLGAEMTEPLALTALVIAILYWTLLHAARGQASLGKAIVGLKVSRLDGRRIALLRSLWREITKPLLWPALLLTSFLPRKQGLHDLLAATYVVREGASRPIGALGIAIAGFALPVFAVPLLLDAALLSAMTARAQGIAAAYVPKEHLPKELADLLAPPAPKPAPKPIQAKAAPKPPPPPPPAPVAKAPEPPPVAQPPAPKPQPVVAALPAPEPQPTPAPKAVAKPKETKKPATKVAARPPKAPAPVATKRPTGLKYNDLMTAVVYRDADEVSQLLKMGKWADKPDSNGMTPLMVAAEQGDLRTAEVLLRAGANPRPALPLAEKRRDGEMVRLLRRY